MPITYALDPQARLVRATVRGSFTAADMLACVAGAAAEVGEAGWNVLSDHREIDEPATRDQVEALVERLSALRRHFAGARWAVVVASPASFGMMRMLEVMAERVPMTVRVFVEPVPAERWARGEVDADADAAEAPGPVEST